MGNNKIPKQYEYKGEFKTLKEWAVEKQMSYQTLYRRIRMGWSFDKIIETSPMWGTFKGVDDGKKITRGQAEYDLNSLPFDNLPDRLKILVKSFGYMGQRYGWFLRNFYKKAFESWFKSEYYPAKLKLYEESKLQTNDKANAPV